ncbi:MAG: beta-L-arabinofuranosidase domain-containing protein [Haliscomenobacter sp.]
MFRFLQILALVFLLWGFSACHTLPLPAPASAVAPEPPSLQPFGLDEVQLLPGPFLQAQTLDKATLLQYEPDRLLAKFRKEAGLAPKAAHYHGWEDDTISGHSLGHFLSACAQMFSSTGDPVFKEKVHYIVSELALCQQADGSGYVAAIPNGKFILEQEVASGKINAQAFYLNGLWAPFYNIHKVMAGLRDAYRLCALPLALDVEKGLADWIYRITSQMTPDQLQQMLACEHGGMNEVCADLFADTKAITYLNLSHRFHHRAVLDPLSRGEDILPGIHCNTQIPKLIGLARRYELSGDPSDQRTAQFFWNRVVYHHSYVTGGNGNHEYFGPADQLRNRLSDETTETCNVYNMLKLTELLFLQQPAPEYADFTERALFNHILASQHPENGRVIYNLSLEMGGKKSYQDPYDFTCCVGSGMENHSKHNRWIYYHQQNTLYINQFIASELNWRSQGVVVRQETSFPKEQHSALTITCPRPTYLRLMIRNPYWLAPGKMRVEVNGRPVAAASSSKSYIELYAKWKNGDRIDIDLPFELRLEPTPDDSNRAAICYGPLVLAGDLGPENTPNPYARDFVPIFKTVERDPAKWLTPFEHEPNSFQSQQVAFPRDIRLLPFYQMHDRRYSVYWDFMSQETWENNVETHLKEMAFRENCNRTAIDRLIWGDTIQEKTHGLSDSNSHIGKLQDRTYREAERGGWFACRLHVQPDTPLELLAEYWGGFTGSKTFDILVDGQPIATENITGKAEGRFIIVPYPIPPAYTQGKQSVEIRFSPHTGHRAGPVFNLWLMEKKP